MRHNFPGTGYFRTRGTYVALTVKNLAILGSLRNRRMICRVWTRANSKNAKIPSPGETATTTIHGLSNEACGNPHTCNPCKYRLDSSHGEAISTTDGRCDRRERHVAVCDLESNWHSASDVEPLRSRA